jgi:hypothetical protein
VETVSLGRGAVPGKGSSPWEGEQSLGRGAVPGKGSSPWEGEQAGPSSTRRRPPRPLRHNSVAAATARGSQPHDAHDRRPGWPRINSERGIQE